MTLPAILKLVGNKVGAVRGSARRRDDKDRSREGLIVVLAYEHLVAAEREEKTGPLARTGWPSARRNHGHLVITKPLDRATPILHKAHDEGDVFSQFVLQCYRVPPAGGGPAGVLEEAHWTIQLTGARIASIRTWMRNVRVPANSAMPECEEVAFTYDAIACVWEALTGNPQSAGQVARAESPALVGDFSRSDGNMIAKRLTDRFARDIGTAVGRQLGDFVKAEGKQLFLDALKEK
ncbi:MAG: type VI secretion system tube protein Hcp [Planctomycetes bacterium]|nr:type VI secretion system tube protein Hcp [Planctomycetota bacterium]